MEHNSLAFGLFISYTTDSNIWKENSLDYLL